MRQGDFHEGANFAAVHKLPVIFMCENNKYAISVPYEKQVHDVSEIQSLTNELNRARQIIRTLEAKYTFADIIGSSEQMLVALEQAKLGAKTPATILLRGESGTGKELFAHAIHNESDRKYNKFVRVNCAAKDKEPDVLVLDIIMPHLDGLAVLERLRESQLKKQPNVIMLTAFGQEDVTKKAVDLGASYFILKPFDMENLVGHIRQVSGNGSQLTHRAPSSQSSVLRPQPESPKRYDCHFE